MEKPASILIVDDEESNRCLLRDFVVAMGHLPVLAADGPSALTELAEQDPDLVLLDIQMPGMDGYEVLKHLKADAGRRDLPVIMISCVEELASVTRCIEMGAEEYLIKPFNPVLLRARVTACLGKKRLRDEERRLHELFGRFYLVTVVLFGILAILPICFRSAQRTGASQTLSSWAALLVLLLPMVHFLERSHLPISTFGLTLKGGGRALLEGMGVAVLLCGALFAARWFTKEFSAPFFSWAKAPGYTPVTLGVYLAAYPLHSFLQELISRGILQGALQLFLGDAHSLVPITVAAGLFGIGHLQFGPKVALLTFGVGLVLGMIYERHRTLVGVSVAHCAVGITAIAIGWI